MCKSVVTGVLRLRRDLPSMSEFESRLTGELESRSMNSPISDSMSIGLSSLLSRYIKKQSNLFMRSYKNDFDDFMS